MVSMLHCFRAHGLIVKDPISPFTIKGTDASLLMKSLPTTGLCNIMYLITLFPTGLHINLLDPNS